MNGRPRAHLVTSAAAQASPATIRLPSFSNPSVELTAPKATGGKIAWVIRCSRNVTDRGSPGVKLSRLARYKQAPAHNAAGHSHVHASKLSEANCKTRLSLSIRKVFW